MAPIIIVIVVAVVAVIGGLAIWAVSQDRNPAAPPETPTATVPATNNVPGSDSPFCLAYISFGMALDGWADYQAAFTSQDYPNADVYVSRFLAAAKELQAAGPPADLRGSVDAIVDYFEKVHGALMTDNVSGITDTDTAAYGLAYLALMTGSLSACYGE